MAINDVAEFVRKHAARGTCRCGKCIDHPGVDEQPTGHTVDLVFFQVSAQGEPDPESFRKLIRESQSGDFCELDPFDGKEHGYMEIGGWIGDQGLALQFMGLGNLLGMWSLLTPRMLRLPDELAMQMAGMGMVAIQASRTPQEAT